MRRPTEQHGAGGGGGEGVIDKTRGSGGCFPETRLGAVGARIRAMVSVCLRPHEEDGGCFCVTDVVVCLLER